jgi:thiosulfate reductase cytochrome b subunit
MVRVTHWANAICLLILLMSGLQIFNAHPALYWGQASTFDHPVLALTATNSDEAGIRGITQIFGHVFDTTGYLGASAGSGGTLQERGFPSWLTLPSYQDLATGRRWHFFFAWLLILNGAVYLLYSSSAAICDAISSRPDHSSERSGIQSGSICSCVSHAGTTPGITTLSRSWPISVSPSCCCHSLFSAV